MDTPKKVTMEEPKKAKRVILLADLDGDEDVVGGAGEKLLFGESTGAFPVPPARPRQA